ncbi:MAG: Ig-like domain repeat protein [Isosphaeraceae bacterium]|nr:Ig-like domain repeat protein [Isosphaeraceae bacterium]
MAMHFRQARRHKARNATSSARRPLAEPLEERWLLSNVFTVTNTLDDGDTGSLRWAITQVDGDTSDSAANPDRIDFNIPQSDPGYAGGIWTIKPVSGLPIVTNPVVIDGYTQSGAAPNTNGPGLGDNATLKIAVNSGSIDIQSSNVVVRGLIVERSGTGIMIDNGNDNVIAGNFIGTDGTSNTLTGNTNAGIMIFSGNGNTIGGTTPDARNLISNNGFSYGSAVSIAGDNNLVAGNFFGTDRTGTVAFPNYFGDISLDSGTGSTIGGTTPAARNIIAGSNYYSGAGTTYGVLIDGASDSAVAGNFIGTDVTGTVALPGNAGPRPSDTIGVAIIGSMLTMHDNTIGGNTAGAGNVIAGNGKQGILIGAASFTPFDSVIDGNRIGTDASGEKALPNAVGIEVDSSDTTIGGTTAAARNIISSNVGDSITAPLIGARGNLAITGLLIEGNYIGTDADGQNSLPNQDGIDLEDVQNSTIGGTTQGAGNLISGNAGDGVAIIANPNQPAVMFNWIAGNRIGTDATGQNPLGNGGDGVFLSGTTPIVGYSGRPGEVFENTIGGTVAGAGNTIAFNRLDGVAIVDLQQSGGTIEENSIYDNGKLGIDHGGTGVPLVNGNALVNFPYLTGESLSPGSVSSGGPTTTITGTFNGAPYATAEIELFSNPTPDPSGFGQGKTYLGSFDVRPTNEDGGVAFAFLYNGNLTGQFITATATYSGNTTSEFSPDFPPPAKGPMMTLSAAPNPALPGQAVTVTVFLPDQPLYVGNTALTPPVTPTGNLALFVDGRDFWNPLGLQPGVNAQGVAGMIATVKLTNLDPGTHVVTAYYNGGSLPPGSSAPLTVTVVSNLPSVVGLSVSPDPASVDQPVTFTAAVTSIASAPGQPLPPPSGFVDFREGTVTLARVPVDATGHAAFTTSTLGAGSHEVVAHYEGDAVFAAATSNTVTEFVNPTVGPTVLSVRRFGIHAQPTAIVLTFSQPLDTASAQNTNNYVIRGLGRRLVPVNFAAYNAVADTVTLTPARNLNLHVRYILTVNGMAPHGIADAYGNLLDGAGHNGTSYATTLTASNLVLGRNAPTGPEQASQLRHHQR